MQYFSLSIAALTLSSKVSAYCDPAAIADQFKSSSDNYEYTIVTKNGKDQLRLSCKRPQNKVDGAKFKDVKAYKAMINMMKDADNLDFPNWGRYKCSVKDTWVPMSKNWGQVGYCPSVNEWAAYQNGGWEPIVQNFGCVEDSLFAIISAKGFNPNNYKIEQKTVRNLTVDKVSCKAPVNKVDKANFADVQAYKAYSKYLTANKIKQGSFKCNKNGDSYVPLSQNEGEFPFECPAAKDWKTFWEDMNSGGLSEDYDDQNGSGDQDDSSPMLDSLVIENINDLAKRLEKFGLESDMWTFFRMKKEILIAAANIKDLTDHFESILGQANGLEKLVALQNSLPSPDYGSEVDVVDFVSNLLNAFINNSDLMSVIDDYFQSFAPDQEIIDTGLAYFGKENGWLPDGADMQQGSGDDYNNLKDSDDYSGDEIEMSGDGSGNSSTPILDTSVMQNFENLAVLYEKFHFQSVNWTTFKKKKEIIFAAEYIKEIVEHFLDVRNRPNGIAELSSFQDAFPDPNPSRDTTWAWDGSMKLINSLMGQVLDAAIDGNDLISPITEFIGHFHGQNESVNDEVIKKGMTVFKNW